MASTTTTPAAARAARRPDRPRLREHGFLFEQLVRRELRRKYQGSVLGLAWYVVNPLVLMGAYYLMFGVVFRVATEPDYPLFIMVGLVVWLFFSQTVTSAAPSLLDQGALVRKARFPRELVPASSVVVQLLTTIAVLALVGVVCVAVRGTLGPALLLLPVVLGLLGLFGLGWALGASVLHAHFRDVLPTLTALLLPWFFLSPIFFRPASITGQPWARAVLEWGNPVAPYITAVRDVVYGGVVPPAGVLAYCAVAALVAVALGLALFRRLERDLAVLL